MLKASVMALGLLLLVDSSAFAAGKKAKKDDAQCSFLLTGNDQIKFGQIVKEDGKEKEVPDLKELKIPSACLQQKITIAIKHVGTLPKAAMGHNVTITTAAKQAEILNKFMAAGPAKDFYDDTVKDGLIGRTDLVGGGETSKPMTIDAGKMKKEESYSFFCSFPGHAGLMIGKVVFVDSPAKS